MGKLDYVGFDFRGLSEPRNPRKLDLQTDGGTEPID
jgi:hypothetical protein